MRFINHHKAASYFRDLDGRYLLMVRETWTYERIALSAALRER